MKTQEIDKLTTNEPNTLFTLIIKLKHFHFEFAIALIKYKGLNYIVEGLFLIPQLFQWLSISFATIHEKHWKNDLIHNRLKHYCDCFMINRLVAGNEIMLYVIFYSAFAFLVGLYAMYLFISIKYFQTNTLEIEQIKQMKPFLFGVMTILYMPLLDLFCSIIHCDSNNNNKSLFLTDLTCWEGIWFLHFVIGALGVIMTVCLALVFQPVTYKSGYNERVPNSKKTGKIDQINACIQFLTIALYAILYGTIDEDREWIKIVFTLFAGNYLVYCYCSNNPYYSDLMVKLQLIKSTIYSWANIVLLLSKINPQLMTGAFHLFLTGIPLLIYVIIISKNKEKISCLYPMHQLSSEEDIAKQIRVLMRMVEERNKERQYLLAIYEYLEFQEDSKIGSPLYHFIHYSENANRTSEQDKYTDSVLLYYLYQHIEEVHQYSLIKYPFSSILLLSYAMFLKDKRGKKKQALIELAKAELNICTFEEEFFIYRLKKEIIEYGKSDPYHDENSHISKFSKGTPHDVSTMIGYQYNFNIFSSLINQIALDYLNFWTLLLSMQKSIRDNLNSLNEYGVKIHKLFIQIHESFHTLQTIKPNDHQVLSLYSSFLKNIKNDISQADMYQQLLSNSNMDIHLFEDNNLLLLNISSLNTEGYYYVICSCKHDSFELITSISINLCTLLGYRKEELLGKELEILIPDFIRVKHKQIIKEGYHKYLQVREISQNKGALREFKLFAKKQSKYLIPIILKGGFVPNEREDIFLFSKFIVDENKANHCYLMTNSNTIIQHCTANALSILNVSSHLFNGNIDIMNYIKEFHEGYVNLQTANKTTTNKRIREQDKEEIKSMVLKEKFCHKKVRIIWRNNGLDSTINKKDNNQDNRVAVSTNCIRRESIKTPVQVQERTLLMTLDEIYFSNTKEAYVFGFEIEQQTVNNMINKIQRNSMMTFTKNKKVKQFGYSISPSKHIDMTIVSNKSLHNISEENYLGLGNSFIPETKSITFDLNTLSYTIEDNSNNIKPKEKLSVVLENKVRDCLNQHTIASKSIPELSSSSYENDSVLEESGSIIEDGLEKISRNQKEEEEDNDEEGEGEGNQKENKKNNQSTYYKVDISKIKLFVYNYNSKQAIEETSYSKLSQIDSKISKEPQKEFKSSFEPQNKTTKPNSMKQISNASENNPKEILNLDDNNNHQSTLQLTNKLDSSVLCLRIINTFITIIILTMGSLYFIFVFSFMKNHKKIALFISSQSVLLSNFQYLSFFSLETILVNNDKYVGYYQSKEEYQSMLKRSLLNTFNESFVLMQMLLTNDSPFSEQIRNMINQLKIQVRVLSLPHNFVFYNLSVFDALFEVLAGSYNLANFVPEKQIFLNDDFLFLVFNNDKTILKGIIDMNNIYQSQHQTMASSDRIRMGIFIGVFIIVLSLAFVLVVYGFDKVRKKKESYLKVFLNLNEFIIKQSIAKCEILIGTKENQAPLYFNSKDNNEEEDETTTLSSSSISGNGKQINELEKEQSKGDKKRNKTVYFKGYHFIIGLFLLAIIISVYTLFWMRLTKIRQYSDIYQLFTQNESKYLSLINSAKLYSMFSTIPSKEISSYKSNLIEFLSTIYSFNEDINSNITDSIELKKFPSNSTAKYQQIFESNICYYLENEDNLKNSNLTCEAFAGNILSFGLNFAFSYYIDQVRNIKIMVEKGNQIALLSGFNYNEAYYGRPYYALFLPKDPVQLALYKKLNPFNIMNTEQFKNINLLLINVFGPAFREIRIDIEQSFDAEFNFENNLNWTLMGFYCFVVLFVFISVLVRKERISNNELQKAKSLLTIIPKNELLKIKNEAESQ